MKEEVYEEKGKYYRCWSHAWGIALAPVELQFLQPGGVVEGRPLSLSRGLCRGEGWEWEHRGQVIQSNK